MYSTTLVSQTLCSLKTKLLLSQLLLGVAIVSGDTIHRV